MKIYTKTGDKGETSLFDGTRVSKSSIRVEAYGNIDELNSYIGLITTMSIPKDLYDILEKVNRLLFAIGTDLATPIEEIDNPKKIKKVKRLGKEHIDYLEQAIDNYSDKLPELRNFILPGGSSESAWLHIARTVCRRAERRVVELAQRENVNHNIIVFLNRLSDFLFIAARYVNFFKGIEDTIWK